MKEILDHPEFIAKLQQIATKSNQSLDQVRSESESYLAEMYTEHEPLVNAFAIQGSQYVLSRAYDKTIDIHPAEVKEVAKLMRRNSVAFVMTHKTYVDMMALALVLVRHGLPIPYTFGGINMSFFGMAQFGRKTGVIFIRRSFKDNEVYKATLRKFIASLVDQKAHFMWAIEGTRSRTGKLVWPKMGILKYIAEADRDSKNDVKYIPVSVVYDLIPDVQEMTEEGRGKKKKPEDLLWFINYIRKMGNKFGRISVRFGDPISMQEEGSAEFPDDELSEEGENYVLPKFAFELLHHINRITPVTTTSLICTTLLSKFALSKKGIERDVSELMSLLEAHKADALVDRGKAIGESVQAAINLLTNAGIVQHIGDGIKTKYSIVNNKYLSATYYSNMAVHRLYHRAFIELALIKVASSDPETRIFDFWQEIMELRDLFKFEFFYSVKSQFTDEIELDLKTLNPQWLKILISGSTDILEELLAKQKVLISQVVLHSYIEAYRVVAQTLKTLDTETQYSEDDLLQLSLFTGEEMHWQGKIHRVDSVSKPFLINGIRLAKNRNAIPDQQKTKKEEIAQYYGQLDDISNRIKQLQNHILNRNEELNIEIPLERQVVPGSRTASVTETVIEGESGAHIGAFFDLDRTLIKGFSAKQFFQRRLLSGRMKTKEVVAQFNGVLVYAMGNRNFAGLASISAQGVKGVDEQVFITVGEEVYQSELADAIYPESRALVAAHMAKGHTVAIISAATPYQVNPIARDLGIEHVMCTRMEVKNGKFTGEIIEPACWGQGKAQAATELATKLNLDLSKSHFYTDSIEDLPLLEIVGHPHPLNPDQPLSALAYKNNWDIYRFSDEERPGISNLIRTGLAFGSLIPAAISGLLTGATSLSWRDGINNMTALVGDLGTKLAGITLVVKGKENLWSHRPAVFIFNHQSNADFFITSKLLRKNAVAIAKKELKFSPIGPLFMAAGVIFIDRSNRDKAIEAMKPAVDALRKGLSVAIAPEGTRSYDYNLGSFKKGAFHLAMDAGVPIVPIVIKNAHDVMPRGNALLKPSAVEVVILKPISTKSWNKSNMEKKIKEIRSKYLKELGQKEQIKILVSKVQK